MLIQELKEKMSKNEPWENLITIEAYLPAVKKKVMVDKIIEGCIEKDENSITRIDYFNKKLFTDVFLVSNYTNLEFSKEYMSDYDFLAENGILDYIFKNINPSELRFIYDLLNKELDQRIKIENDLAVYLIKKANELVDKIPDEKRMRKIINTIPKAVNKINPDNLNILKEMVNDSKKNNIKH